MNIIRTSAIALAAAAIAIGTATAASAAPADGPGTTPVNASVTVQTGLTVTGISGSVDFGSATVGQTVTVPGAEQYEIATNSPGGYSVTLSAQRTSWLIGNNPPQPSNLGNDALSVKNSAGATVHAAPGMNSPVVLESGPAGDKQISEDWSLTIPASFTQAGAFQNTYAITVQPS